MKAILFCGQNIDLNKYNLKDSYLIGVDNGALILANNKIEMDLALGDFDTAKEENLNLIMKYSKKIKKLNPIKDDTDTFDALEIVYGKYDEILVLGEIQGKRVEHLISNIYALKKYKGLKLIDDYSLIEIIDKDKEFKKDEYKYISFFSLKDSIVSFKGFKYNLDNYYLKVFDPICISNEIVDDIAYLTLDGEVLCIKSMDDNK